MYYAKKILRSQDLSDNRRKGKKYSVGLGQPPHKDIAFLLQRKVWGQNTLGLYQQDNRCYET